MRTSRASRTAVLVCQGRACSHGRAAVGRFADPVAEQVLRPDERRTVERVRSGELPRDLRARLAVEQVRASAEGVVPRTVAIDEAVRQAGHRQVVVLGAGLDTRPWRLAALRDAVVFSVDHPASQSDARARTAGLVPVVRRLEFVPVDLAADDLGGALATAGHDPATPTTWVWEGVVPYLTGAQVRDAVAGIAARSAPGSVLAVHHQTRSWRATAGRWLAQLFARAVGADDPLAGEPWRSGWSPAAIGRLLTAHGFAVSSDEDLLVLAGRLASPSTHRRSLATGRVAVARRA